MKINSEQIIAISIFRNYKSQLDIYYRKIGDSNKNWIKANDNHKEVVEGSEDITIFSNSSNSLTACSIEK